MSQRPSPPSGTCLALTLALAASTGSIGGIGLARAEPSSTNAKPTPKLPPPRAVDDILKDVVAALGGADALGRHRSLHTKMSIVFQGLGISGTAEHYGAAGDKALTITAIPNVASTREGSDGSQSWSQDPINGLRILTGVEAEQARVEAAWNSELRMRELFPKIEARSDVGDDGARLECLVMTPKLGPEMTECFDAGTHLLVSQRGVRSGPQGDTPFVARMKDWRRVADMKVPFVTEMQVGPLAFVGTVTSAELDVPVEAALFALPDTASGNGVDGNGATGLSPKGRGKGKAGTGARRQVAAPRTPALASPTTP